MYDVSVELGRGSHGQVFALTAKDSDRLAAKVINQADTWENELAVWPQLKHENIVPLIGFVCMERYDVFIMPVYECTLHQMLQKNEFRQDPSSFVTTVKWLKDIACGLEYLHRSHLCHLGLKPANVLISAEQRALLCDFGYINTTERPIDRYSLRNFSPPESWNFGKNNLKSPIDGTSFDIWTYGILVLRCMRHIFPETGIRFRWREWKVKEYPLLYNMLQVATFNISLSKSFPRSDITRIQSSLALNFIKGILRFDPLERPQAKEIMEHRMLSDTTQGTLFEQNEIWYGEETQAADAVVGSYASLTECE